MKFIIIIIIIIISLLTAITAITAITGIFFIMKFITAPSDCPSFLRIMLCILLLQTKRLNSESLETVPIVTIAFKFYHCNFFKISTRIQIKSKNRITNERNAYGPEYGHNCQMYLNNLREKKP